MKVTQSLGNNVLCNYYVIKINIFCKKKKKRGRSEILLVPLLTCCCDEYNNLAFLDRGSKTNVVDRDEKLKELLKIKDVLTKQEINKLMR